MYEDTICPACGSVNDFAGSFLGKLGSVDHHRCAWCGSQYFTDEIEDGFGDECERQIEFISLLPEPGMGDN